MCIRDRVSAVQQEIRRLSMDESEKLRLVETLKFQIDEIERAELQSGEEDELLERRKVLQNAEKLTGAMEAAVSALYGDVTSDGAAAMIANAAHALERVSRVSDEMRQLSGKLSDLMSVSYTHLRKGLCGIAVRTKWQSGSDHGDRSTRA